MKKTLIAIASIAAMGAASAAGPTVYGRVDVNVSSTSGGGAASQTTIGDNGYSTSNFGVKGDMDLGGGLKGIYQYETGVPITKAGDIKWGGRGAYAGVAGAFGTVTMGTVFTPYAISLFGDAAGYDGFSAYWLTPSPGSVHADTVWRSNSVAYTTPSMNGLTINALIAPGGNATNKASTSYELNKKTGEIDATPDGIHGASSFTGLGASYAIGKLSLAAGWDSEKDGATDVTTTGSNIFVGYDFGVANATAAFQKGDNGKNQDSGWLLAANIPLGGTYAAQVSYASQTSTGADLTGTATVIGLLNDIKPGARLYAAVYTKTLTKEANSNGVKAGVRFDF